MGKSLLRSRTTSLRRQGGRCFYCRVLMWTDDCASFAERHRVSPRVARWLQCTAEHLTARSDGGRDSLENIAAACRLCNHRRHARKKAPAPEAFQTLVRSRVCRGRWHDPQVFASRLLQT